MDPGLFEVFAVCYGVGDVFLGDDAYRLAGMRVQDHEHARARVLHKVRRLRPRGRPGLPS